MAYRDFKLGDVIKKIKLTLIETLEIFADISELECIDILKIYLQENLDLTVSINKDLWCRYNR